MIQNNMACGLEKIESEFKKIWRAIEELQMTRQARDEFRAEIWQAIEELRQSQPSSQPIKADPYKMPYIETATNYCALYEKEKETWDLLNEFMLGHFAYMQTNTEDCMANQPYRIGYGDAIKMVLDKIQGLEEK